MTEEIPLSRVIFRPLEAYNQQKGGLDTLIFGFLLTPSAKFDSMFSSVLRNHLFEAEKVHHPGNFLVLLIMIYYVKFFFIF